MLLIAHRGYAEGKEENSLAALNRAAADSRVDGVELDIRLSRDRSDVILRHDPFTSGDDGASALGLDEALRFAAPRGWQVFLECKEYDQVLYRRVHELVDAHGVADRVVLFGFKHIARRFPWHSQRPFRFGIIEEYPWGIPETVRSHRPDVVLMGWMSPWTRRAVQSWWSTFSLRRLTRKFPHTSLVMGVAQTRRQIEWLRRQNALFAATVDFTPLMDSGHWHR